ncbi:MAG: maleylpyruvate isomerase N-terminal domain-containing protein [Chloroflexi bacterium]|nr:maleylpyruvate isomerase N-terminal domain-containing protein [Chloroflexota bacterium]
MQSIDTLQSQVDLIRSESSRLMQYVNDLPPEALENPSPCDKWNVGEVIAHLDWFADTYGGMMERGLRDDQSPTEGLPSVPPGTPNRQVIVDEYYGQAAIDRRRSLGQDLIPAFTERFNRLNNVLAGIGPEDWDKPCYHPSGLRAVESFIPTIISELALHEWDIRSTLEPSPAVSEGSIPVLMEKIPGNRGRPWSISFPDMKDAPGPIRYRFELTGEAGGKRDILVEGNKARMEPAGDGSANLTLAGDTGTFILLMYGRLRLESAIATGGFDAKGNLGLVPGFDRWLEGV